MEDQSPDKTGIRVEEVASKERSGSIDYTRSVQSDDSGRSLGEHTLITLYHRNK